MGAATAAIEVDVRPPGPYRLPPAGRDGIMRRRADALVRVLHHRGEPATAAAWPVSGAVRVRVEGRTGETAAWGVERTRREQRAAWGRPVGIRGFGPGTVEEAAVHGQGRGDQLPAGDLAYSKLVGRLAGLDRRATVDEVREFFAPYAPHAALAGIYLLNA